MGIPKMMTNLNSYGTQEPLENFDVVLDGHALAYHIYELCIRGRSRETNAIEVQPTYLEVTEMVIFWLDMLLENQVAVKKIFFDGFLPHTKLKHRSKKLGILTRRLEKYHTNHAFPCKKRARIQLTSMPLFGTTSGVDWLTYGCTPPPFLVPAVFETLCETDRYKNISEVVPWEADHYCSNYVREHGGLIISGDTDFFIHDLGPNGAVAFFRGLERSPSNKKILATVYRPNTISNRLGLHESYGLSSLAFEMITRPENAFAHHLNNARSHLAIRNFRDKYEKFMQEYNIRIKNPDSTVNMSSTKTSRLRTLDPRVSEYVLQYPCFAEVAGQPFRTRYVSQEDSHHIFLPFSLDCPSRKSSWEVSSAVRQVAYSLINTIVPQSEKTGTVIEHRKQKGEVSGRELLLPTLSQITMATAQFSTNYVRLKKRFPHFKNHEIWIAMTILQDIEWSWRNDKIPVVTQFIKLFEDLGSNFTSDWDYSWDLIHFIAQIHASLYSFRIMQQIAEITFAFRDGNFAHTPILDFYQHLRSLPQLRDYMDRESLVEFLRTHLACINNAAVDLLRDFHHNTFS